MNREYFKWYSPALGKEMEILVFGHGGAPVLFFPTRTAHFYDYENWNIIYSLKNKIEEGHLQIFCVDSVDVESFYADIHPADKIKRHLQYEQYILNEVIPKIRQVNHNPFLISAGCSLGGYHAVNIALKHPQYFKKVVGMSARYDLTLSASSFHDLFHGYVDENVYYNMPSMYVPNLNDGNILNQIRQLQITIIIGKEDPFFENNLQLSQVLNERQIAHDFYVWEEEAHRPRYWRKMVGLYL